MTEVAQKYTDVSALIRSAMTAREALGLKPEQTERLTSLYCSVCIRLAALEPKLARREDDLTRALAAGAVDLAGVPALIGDVDKLRTDLERETAAGFGGLRTTLTSEQFAALLALQDNGVTGAATASDVKLAVDAYLDQKIKNKDVVEVEVAARIADRVFGWVKLFGFFLAAPVSVVMLGLSVFGITQVKDIYSRVADYETRLEDALKSATKGAEAIRTKVAALEKQGESLRSDVAQLQKCVFGDPEATKAGLASALSGFRAHMVEIGFAADAPTLPIEIDPKNMVSNAYSYYDKKRQRIVLSSCAAGDTGMVFHEYGHYVLEHLLGFDEYKANDRGLDAVELGLASYFACSYQNDPVLGRPQAQAGAAQPAADAEPLIDLENRRMLADAGSIAADDFQKLQELADAWGGLFWQIRKAIGPQLADRAMLAAWRSLPPPGAKNHPYSAEMAAQLLSQVRTRAGAQQEDVIRRLFKDRALAS